MYFLCSSESVFIGNLVMFVNLYVITKIIHLFFYLLLKISKKSIILALINKWFLINTRWWTLPISFIESNMVMIAYNTFSQFRPNSTSYFSFDNKVNSVTAFSVMFLFLAYAFCFYILFYKFAGRRISHTLLNYSRFGLGGFLF